MKSKHLNIQTRECRFNPDWDEDLILNLFELFSQFLDWDCPKAPTICYRINGEKNIIKLDAVLKKGLNSFILKNKVFSYAITSPSNLKYTIFNNLK